MEGLRGQDPRVRGATDGHDPGVEPEAHKEQTYQGGGQASNGREELLPGRDLNGKAHPVPSSPLCTTGVAPPRPSLLADLQPLPAHVECHGAGLTVALSIVPSVAVALPIGAGLGRRVKAGQHGIITQDDVADILEEEATEDIERLGGSQPLEMPYLSALIPLLVRRRVVWLLLLFAAEAYTGTVLRAFDDEIAKVVALSYFIPLLIGTGGNIGSQTTTTLVRAVGLGEVRLRDVGRVLGKEVAVGLILGAIMAVVAYGRAELLGTGAQVAQVVALTIAAICVWSATVAAVLPLLLRRFRIDPAVVSASLITTLVDGTGLVIYFTIAKRLLGL